MPDRARGDPRNAAANGVSVRTHWLNLAATAAPWAPTVTANLTLDLLAAIAADLAGAPARAADRLRGAGRARRRDRRGVRAPRPARVATGACSGEWAAVCWSGLIRLAVRVARADAEAVLAELLELAPGGLEEREVDETPSST